ncbi:hypothetical protein B0T17DRAFT_544818 [Bombardia bombarda]|uniref:Uncharacterized protein n=1 Tax=Bombardia bombarda TaxID=252184 RepID=A0AA39U3V5_9PEZI|nr:hypothetical protein B0T17DRAFT_544818 [Bombardia bombarda]
MAVLGEWCFIKVSFLHGILLRQVSQTRGQPATKYRMTFIAVSWGWWMTIGDGGAVNNPLQSQGNSSSLFLRTVWTRTSPPLEFVQAVKMVDRLQKTMDVQ